MTVHTWSDNERLYAADLNASFSSVLNVNAAIVTHSGAQTLSTSTVSVLAFDTETQDAGGFHSNVTNNSRLTIPVTGWYLAGANIEYAANATGYRETQIRANGSAVLWADTRLSLGAGAATRTSVSGPVILSAGSYIECIAWQNSGGNLAIGSVRNFWIVALRGT